jgi:hypothetical protein
MSDSLIAGSTNVVELVGLQDTVTDLYPVDATVTCAILCERGGARKRRVDCDALRGRYHGR